MCKKDEAGRRLKTEDYRLKTGTIKDTSSCGSRVSGLGSLVYSLWSVVCSLTLFFSIVLTGCGVPQAEYDALEKEIGILEDQLDQNSNEKLKVEKANAELAEGQIRLEQLVRDLTVEKTALEGKIKILEEELEGVKAPAPAVSGVE